MKFSTWPSTEELRAWEHFAARWYRRNRCDGPMLYEPTVAADRRDYELMCEAQDYRQRGYWRLMYCERQGGYIPAGGEHLYRGPEGMK